MRTWKAKYRNELSELSQTNLELHKVLAERRQFQMEMNQISEERQKMIGQELHDGLGQQLTGITFLVTSLHETLGAKSAPEIPIVRQVKDLLAESISMVRLLSRGLYPVALETGGFPSALQHLAEYAQNSSDIQCTVQFTANANVIEKAIALNLYRIAQEAVSNAVRHSKAHRIEIKLSGNWQTIPAYRSKTTASVSKIKTMDTKRNTRLAGACVVEPT